MSEATFKGTYLSKKLTDLTVRIISEIFFKYFFLYIRIIYTIFNIIFMLVFCIPKMQIFKIILLSWRYWLIIILLSLNADVFFFIYNSFILKILIHYYSFILKCRCFFLYNSFILKIPRYWLFFKCWRLLFSSETAKFLLPILITIQNHSHESPPIFQMLVDGMKVS